MRRRPGSVARERIAALRSPAPPLSMWKMPKFYVPGRSDRPARPTGNDPCVTLSAAIYPSLFTCHRHGRREASEAGYLFGVPAGRRSKGHEIVCREMQFRRTTWRTAAHVPFAEPSLPLRGIDSHVFVAVFRTQVRAGLADSDLGDRSPAPCLRGAENHA